MINLLNKLLSRFHLQLVYTKPDTSLVEATVPDTSLVEATVRFMNDHPKYFDGYDILESTYVGDINYVKERVEGEFPQVSGKTYFKSQIPTEKNPFFNFDGEKLSEYQLEKRLKK